MQETADSAGRPLRPHPPNPHFGLRRCAATLARTRDRQWLTRRLTRAPDSYFMTHFLATVLASLAAAAVFTLLIPAEAASVEWEFPSSVRR